MMDQFIWQYKVVTPKEACEEVGIDKNSGPDSQMLQKILTFMSRKNWGYTGTIIMNGNDYLIFSKMVVKEPIQ